MSSSVKLGVLGRAVPVHPDNVGAEDGVQRVGTPQEGHDAATYSPRRLLTWSTFMVQIDCPLPFVDVSYCAHGAAASIAAAIWFRISILRLLQPAVGSWLSTGAQAQKQQFYIIDLMHIFRFHFIGRVTVHHNSALFRFRIFLCRTTALIFSFVGPVM